MHQICALLLSVLFYQAWSLTLPTWGTSQARTKGKKGAVSSESAICSKVGADLIEVGGNAADAIVGTVFCIGVIAMYHSGIGGGGFMIVRGPRGTYEVIDFRETAPAAAFEDMYRDNVNASLYGGLASGVPSEIRGLEHLHRNYGHLPWHTVMQPAIHLARYGFPVTADLVKQMDAGTKGVPNFLIEEPDWAIDFAPNGTRVGLGDTLTRKRYADTLETISEEGADAFYEGAIAKAMIQALKAKGGTMTLEDLKNYTVEIREPAQIQYRGRYVLTSCGAPSSGTVALSVMKIFERFEGMGDLAKVKENTHLLDEAIRFGYGERANLGDPSFFPTLAEYEREMLNLTTASRIQSLISPAHTLNISSYDPMGLESIDTPGTSHIVAADHSGLAISLTTTVNLLFGSGLIVPATGVIMNNEMNDFSIPGQSNAFGYKPSPANFIRPGKRPLSSISPVIVEHASNSSLYFVTGSAGGSRILTATIQSLWHVLDQGFTTQEALSLPRFHDQLVPNTFVAEYSYDNNTADYLRSLGHNVTYIPVAQSSMAALRRLSSGIFEVGRETRQVASGGVAV